MQRMHKLTRKLLVNSLRGHHHKLHAVTGSKIKYFGNTKLRFYVVQLACQVLLADHQFPQLLQLDLLVRKSNYL